MVAVSVQSIDRQVINNWLSQIIFFFHCWSSVEATTGRRILIIVKVFELFFITDSYVVYVNISIFSPPYANCFDPFEVYKVELWVGEFVSSYDDLREKRRKALASNLNADLKREVGTTHRTELLDELLAFLSGEELWDKRIPRMLDIYFHDMLDLLSSLYSRTESNGFCVIVVGNSAYGKLAIPLTYYWLK